MRLILFTGLLMLPLMSTAQETEGESLLLQQYSEDQEVLTVPRLKTTVMDRFDFGLEAGTAYTTFGRHGSMFSSYLAPEISYQATPRIRLNAGVILSTGFISRVGLEGSGPAGAGQSGAATNLYNRHLVFAEGIYRVNQRLSIGGMVVKELDHDLYRQINAFERNSGFQSLGMSVDYKITENIHVGARFNVAEGRPYYYTDPANPFIRRSIFSPGW